jgi:hypothetical protein
MRKVVAVVWALAFLPTCGGGDGSSNPTAVPSPPTTFGPGQFRVNSRIQPGRYFSDPDGSGCYWERESGLGGRSNDVIANAFIDYDAPQVIVDILSSDVAFMSAACGNWFDEPREEAHTDIPPGEWLVGPQIAPGTYHATVGSGCYWERDRDFQGVTESIIANAFIENRQTAVVSISANDVGFINDGRCGTWTRFASATEPSATSERRSSDIATARRRHRELAGLQ